jgi:hypothetical protein
MVAPGPAPGPPGAADGPAAKGARGAMAPAGALPGVAGEDGGRGAMAPAGAAPGAPGIG